MDLDIAVGKGGNKKKSRAKRSGDDREARGISNEYNVRIRRTPARFVPERRPKIVVKKFKEHRVPHPHPH
jgi:hypothetical protein